MSKTPRTDALKNYSGDWPQAVADLKELSGQLETELSTVKEQRDALSKQLRNAERWLSGMFSDSDGDQVTELREIHSAAWEVIDRYRDTIAKCGGEV